MLSIRSPFLGLTTKFFHQFQNGLKLVSRNQRKQSSTNYKHLAFAAGISFSLYKQRDKETNSLFRKAKACGIVAMAGDEDVVDYLLEGLTILQNRGYDSAGIASISTKNPASKEINCTKFASLGSTSDSLNRIKQKKREHATDKIGIAHTRWATHGGKTDFNAHPHIDYSDRISIVHNGTIENCFELKDELLSKGILFKSETDTEVIANLIGYYLNQGKEIEEAFEMALSRLDGSWGIAMLCKDRPDEIFAARHGSPLMIGIDEQNKRNFIASEHTAFSKYTNQYIALNDGEMAIVSNDKIKIFNEDDWKNRIEKTPDEDIVSLTPEPYPHWTLKEIYEGPEAVLRSLSNGARLTYDYKVKLGGLDSNAKQLTSIKNLIMTGCGTSLNASLYGKKVMNYLNSFDTVECIDSAEITMDSVPRNGSAGMLAITQSGETKDVVTALEIASKLSLPKFSIVNAVGSLIARMTGLGVYLQAGREHGVASTKAFLSQVTVLTLIAAWFAQHRNTEKNNLTTRIENITNSLQRLSIYVGITLNDTKDICKRIAKDIYNSPDMFVLGKGFSEPIAYEGALKIKEITYCHCEGYSGGALKHGPFALIENDTPIIMIILDDEHGKVMKTNAAEVTSRGAKLIIITDNKDMFKNTEYYTSDKHYIIEIPKNGVLTALLAVVPLQLIAYEMAVLKGVDPDKPKNLAKAVTVS